MLKFILLCLAVLIAAILLYATTRPNTFRVSRSITVNAPPERIFPLIDEWNQWFGWSPYEKVDPAMKRRFSGPAAGKGAVYEFEGNSQVGAGRLEILESMPPSRIAIQLDMRKPIEGHNLVEFTLQPEGGTTRVTWTMTGNSVYLSKLIGIFLNMDRTIGKSFETGLADLKALAEKVG